MFDVSRNLKVVLDTTNSADYVATWFLDDVQIDTRSIGAPSLTHVFINKHSGSTSGTVDNFQLTTVPEPSSVALLSLGGLVLLRRRRN